MNDNIICDVRCKARGFAKMQESSTGESRVKKVFTGFRFRWIRMTNLMEFSFLACPLIPFCGLGGESI